MLPIWYKQYKNYIEENIEIYLNKYFEKNNNNSNALKNFEEVIRYSVLGGKKIRAILALEFYLILTNKKLEELDSSSDIIKVCLSLEFIHTYSLLQDDMPCMDNDILRRGKPTVWSKYGEYNAMLASDVLNTLSYEILSEIEDKDIAIEMTKTLSKSTGFYGMIGGQIEDLYFEENPELLTKQDLLSLHRKKTGKLITSSVQMGIIMSGNTKHLNTFSSFGEKLGLAFQIKDDILDVEGTVAETGKSVGQGNNEKKGFIFFEGLQKSKQSLNNLITSCSEISKPLKSDKLEFIIDYVGSRKQ
ncbi:MAG: polyprenyl synthetase family protein [Candidatus Gracilibacteria bacterium]|nr:polyprenyl synthetase family protein [Candidatus Gracilibacteria bacterium]